MLRKKVILLLIFSMLSPKLFGQEWLAGYNKSVELYNNNQLAEAYDVCQKALIQYDREASPDHANYRALLRQLSVISYELNQLEAGRNYAEKEVASWRSATTVDESSYIDALDNLGMIYSALGEYVKAVEVHEESYNLAKQSAAKAVVETAIIEGHLAQALYMHGNLTGSSQHFESCLQVLDKQDELPGDYINFCYSYGNLCVEQAKYDEATHYLQMLYQWYNEEEPDPLVISNNMALGTAYTQSGNLPEGERYFVLAKKAMEETPEEYQHELVEVSKLLALNLEEQGKHDQAEALLAGISAQIMENSAPGEEQASYLNSQATVLMNSGKISEAIGLYDQAIRMLDSLELTGTELYASIGLNAVRANYQALNLVKGADLALKIRSYQQPESLFYYLLTAELGSLYQKQGAYEEANNAFELIVASDRTAWPDQERGQILNRTASYYQTRGKYDRSKDLYAEALAVVDPQESKTLYQSLMFNYITLLQAKGELSEAQQLLQSLKETVGTTDPQIYLGILRNIGSLAQARGDFKTANSQYQEALQLASKLAGENSLLYADILLRIATLEKDLGDYEDAEPDFIRVSEIIAGVQGKNNPNYASVLNNMGILYQQMGNLDKAEASFLEARAIYEKAFGVESPDYVLTQENLATLYEMMGDEASALKILASTLEANKKIYGEHNPNYAISLHNYASLLQKSDRKEEAFDMFVTVLRLQEQAAGKMQPSYANSLHNLAILAQEQEKYELADSLIDEVLTIRAALFDKNHPSYTQALYSKAVILQVTDRYDQAWTVYNQVIDQYLNQIEKYFPSLSEREKNAFYATVTPVINRYKEFCLEYYVNYKDDPLVLDRLYDVQLVTKAILLSAVNKTRTRILNSGDDQLIEKFNQWTNVKKQLVNYYRYSKEQRLAEGIDIQKLEEDANTLEKELSRSSALFAREFDKQNPTWKDVAGALNADEAAVELIRLERNGIEDSVSYVALGLLADSPHPQLAVLGYGNKMEGKYYNYYKNTVKFEVDDRRSYIVYWQPIDQIVSGAKTVYISADGVYNKININTIHNRKTGRYLIEDYFVKYISSTRDLLEPVATESTAATRSILCFGNPAYDLKGNPGRAVILNDRQRSQFNMNRISALPGTEREIKYIDSLLKDNNWQVQSYLGKEALEIRLKNEMNAAKVIHLATHGFFMRDLPTAALESQSGRNEYDKNPLFRSGLLFAGASNDLEDSNNDGILTAYEAMNLNLDDTELVILSACETALGDVKNGEGVYGLQRALLVAGADNLIMSLWKVDDQATMELMSMFYTNWANGENIYEAMKMAQLAMIKNGRPPYDWGAFIMIGR